MSLIVFTLDNVEEWNNSLKEIGQFDFYHTNSYHRLAFEAGEGDPELIKFSRGPVTILLPLLKRPIENSNHIDYTSVYGYPSLLCNVDQIDYEIASKFKKELCEFFISNEVVSVFSRLHPMFKSDLLFDLGNVFDSGKTVTIDLAIPIEEQWRVYRKSLRSEINQLRKKHGVIVRDAVYQSDMDGFVEMYYENMNRVNASGYYLFGKEYFKKLFSQKEYKIKLKLAEKDGRIIAGAIFTYVGDIIQYHLAATSVDFLSITPMKLIIDEVRLEGSNFGFKKLHLGGGLGGNEEDSLFRFKSGFSKDFLDFKVWKYIANTQKYDELVEARCIDEDNSFFPLYRK